MVVTSLYRQCLIFIAENSSYFNEASLTDIPNVLLESLLNYWSAYDLQRLGDIYVSHGISTSEAWKNHMKTRPECFRNNPATFQTERLYDNPQERYLARHFQDMLAYLTYDGFDPIIRFHMCLHRLWGQRIELNNTSSQTISSNKRLTTAEEAEKITKHVKTLTLFGKQSNFLLESPALLLSVGRSLQRLVLHNPRDHMFPAIRSVVSELLKFDVLEHISLFHSMLSQENMLDLLKLCSGQQSSVRNSSETDLLMESPLESVVCQCSACISVISVSSCIQPKAKLYCSLTDCETAVGELPFAKATDEVQNKLCLPCSASNTGNDNEIDLFNEAIKPMAGSTNSFRRLFNSKNVVPTSVKSLSIISSGYNNLDLESILVEVLSGWHSLQRFALQSTWLQRKRANGTTTGNNHYTSLTNVLKDMISLGQLTELVIEETRDILENRTSSLEVLEAVMHGRKRTNPMKALKLKDLYNFKDFAPIIPSSGIEYHGIVHLDLAKNMLSGGFFSALVYIVQHDLSLSHLGIAGCGLNELELIQLFESITLQQRLVSLDISAMSLSEASLSKLNDLIKMNTSLRELIMVYCQLNAVFEKVSHVDFCNAVAKSSLTSIVLSQNRLGKIAVEIVESISLQQEPCMKLLDIDISYNTISLAYLNRLGNFLQETLQERPKRFLNSLCLTGNVSAAELPPSSLYRMFSGITVELQAENSDLTGLHADHVSQM